MFMFTMIFAAAPPCSVARLLYAALASDDAHFTAMLRFSSSIDIYRFLSRATPLANAASAKCSSIIMEILRCAAGHRSGRQARSGEGGATRRRATRRHGHSLPTASHRDGVMKIAAGEGGGIISSVSGV